MADKKKPSDVQPTERQRQVAELINSGMDVEEAMEEASYGLGCIKGLAPVLVAGLKANPHTASLIAGGGRRGKAAKAPAADATPPPADPTTTDSGKGAKAPAA